MATLLVRNAEVLVTMDDARREIAGGGLFARDGWIGLVGPTESLPAEADEVIDASGQVVIPGLVNTHHHLYQTLTRAFPGAQDSGLFDWLRTLYPVWARMTPNHIRTSTKTGLAELALSGCTTTSDHLYLYPNGSRLDDQVEAAGEVGVRFHVARGSMSLGESDGGLPPDSVVESEDAILEDCRRVVAAYHDPDPGAMVRVVIAPCSPFSVSTDLMRESAELARDLGVTLHTHLAETADEEDFCLERFGLPPFPYAESVGWFGPDVWFAHAVHPGAGGPQWIGATGSGVAHCPTSNMRLASGIAPVAAYLDEGARVGLGVDGSASNDGSHMLAEARQAMLVGRLASAPGIGAAGPLLEVRRALELATRGGAAVLGRSDLGSLEAGKLCDFAAFAVDDLPHAGGLADPVAALVLCTPGRATTTVVGGRPIVRNRSLTTVDTEQLVVEHNRLAHDLWEV